MFPQLDIFKLEKDGSVVWKEAAENLEVANSSIELFATSSPGNYMIFSQVTGCKTIVTLGTLETFDRNAGTSSGP
jgi:hypothetical protein